MAALRLAAGILILAFLPAAAQLSESEISPRLQDLLKTRQYPEAEQLIREKLEFSPAWEKGHLLLAQICMQTGRYESAERSAASAIHIRESLDGLMLLALATMRLNRLNDSIGWLDKAAQRSPEYPEIYKLLGMDYALGGMLRDSEKAFRKAIQLGPENWEYYYFHGRALFELGRLQEALPSLKRALELNGQSVKAWTALGQVQERVGPEESAQTSYHKAVDLCGAGPDCAWPLLQIGYIYTRQSNFKEALRYFRKAVQARPDWARPHFHLAKTLVELDDLQGARKELEDAVRLDDSKSEYQYQLAQVYRRLGEVQKATAAFARFRSMAQVERNTNAGADFSQP